MNEGSSVRARRPVESFAWIALVVTTAVYFFLRNVADNDLWMHVFFGKLISEGRSIPTSDTRYTYTAAGAPWINHEWLAQILLGAVFDILGSPGLLALKALCGACTARLIWLRLSGGILPVPAAAFVLVITIAVIARGFAIRPQIFTYLFLALTYEAIERERRGKPALLWLWPLVVALWVNLHAGFMAGLCIMWGYLIWSSIVERRFSEGALFAATAGTGSIIANPYGLEIMDYLMYELTIHHPITEWAPVSISDPAQLPFLALVIVAALSLPLSVGELRRQGWKLVVAAVALYMAFRHQRHTALFAVCAAPAIGMAGERFTEATKDLRLSSISRLVTPAVLLLAAFQLGSAGINTARHSFRVAYESRDYPSGAVEFLARRGFQGNVAVPLEWGNYVIWHLGPDVRVSLDGRFATIYQLDTIQANFDLFGGFGTDWARLLERWPTDAILAPRYAVDHLAKLGDWEGVYEDLVSIVFVRKGIEIAHEKRAWPKEEWLYFP